MNDGTTRVRNDSPQPRQLFAVLLLVLFLAMNPMQNPEALRVSPAVVEYVVPQRRRRRRRNGRSIRFAFVPIEA